MAQILSEQDQKTFDEFFLKWCDSIKASHDMRAVLMPAILSYSESLKLIKLFFNKKMSFNEAFDMLKAVEVSLDFIKKIDEIAIREHDVDMAKANEENEDEVAGAKDSATDLALTPASTSTTNSVLSLLPKKKQVTLVLEPEDGANVKAGQTITQSGAEKPEGALPIPEFGPMRPPSLRRSGTPLVLADEELGVAGVTEESGDSEGENVNAPTLLGKPGLHRQVRPPVLEKYGPLDWFKNFKVTYGKWKKNKEISAAQNKSQNGSKKTSGKSDKTPVKKGVWWIVSIFAIALLIFGYYIATGNRVSDIIGGIGGEPSAPVVPDQGLTSMTPEEKESWANARLSSSVTETFLTKPTSFVDFFTNWNSYLNWLLYIAAVLLVSFSIFRERTQSAEFSDIRQYIIGISSALMFITLSNLIGNWAFSAGWTTSPIIFQYVSLVVGFLINIFMQYSAYDSGNKDASVLAAGVYIFGLLLKWWFPLDVLLSTVGFAMMVLGLVIQYLEIGRHADRDSNAMAKSLTASVLMLVVFSAVYIWMYGLLESQIASFVIPADAAAQAGAAIKLNLLVKGQIATSALVALLLSYVFGLVYGSIFLPTRGRDGTVDIRSALVLDADASTLFVMFLFLFLPWIWVLPKFWLLVFG